MKLLAKYKKPSYGLEDADFCLFSSQYQRYPVGISEKEADEIYESSRRIYRDTSHTIMLLYGTKVVACIGFEVLEDKSFYIRQVQGVLGSRKILAQLQWDQMLITYLIQIAKKCGVRGVSIQPAENNKWYERPYQSESRKPIDMEKHQASLRRRYDETATYMGFKKAETGSYVLSL